MLERLLGPHPPQPHTPNPPNLPHPHLDEGEKKNVLNFPLSKFSTGTLISADSLPCTHPHRHAHTIQRRCHAASGLARQSRACAACKHPMNFLSRLTLGFVFVCFVFRYSALIQTDCSHGGWNLICPFCSSTRRESHTLSDLQAASDPTRRC